MPLKGEAVLAVNNEYLLKQWVLALNLIRDLEQRSQLENRGRLPPSKPKKQAASGSGAVHFESNDFFSARSTSSYFCTPQVNSWHLFGEQLAGAGEGAGEGEELKRRDSARQQQQPDSAGKSNSNEQSSDSAASFNGGLGLGAGVGRFPSSFLNQTVSTISPPPPALQSRSFI